jgi:alpha-tubulin suppressor-like RCC1 family protein
VLSPFEVIPDSVVAVAVGWTHTCAVKDTGTVSCWGNNSYGQLGIGVPGDQLTPALVTGITDAYDVVAGNVHTCMLHQDDAIQCWGFNRQGQLGPKGKEIQLKPVGGPALKAIQLAAGAFHTCALKTDRTVWCWGSNDHGQLGRTTTGDHDANAAAVPGIAGASRIATGAYHSCAVHSGGSVSCWGANENGQSGADPSAKQVGPTAVPLPTAYDIAAGYAHSCALVAGGRLKCWGENKFGELTDGTNKSSWKPVP